MPVYVCSCLAVTDRQVRACVALGARTVEEVGDACEAGTGCGSCHEHIDAILAASLAPSEIVDLPATA